MHDVGHSIRYWVENTGLMRQEKKEAKTKSDKHSTTKIGSLSQFGVCGSFSPLAVKHVKMFSLSSTKKGEKVNDQKCLLYFPWAR